MSRLKNEDGYLLLIASQDKTYNSQGLLETLENPEKVSHSQHLN